MYVPSNLSIMETFGCGNGGQVQFVQKEYQVLKEELAQRGTLERCGELKGGTGENSWKTHEQNNGKPMKIHENP